MPIIFLLVLWITPPPVAGQSDITLDFTAEPKIAGFEPPVSRALAATIKAAGGKIALDGKTVKQAAGSLRWDWHAGDVLRLRIPAFDSNRTNGPYATWRPCVQFWIHPDKDSVDPLVLTTDAVTGKPPVQIPIALNHGGTWRRTILSYVNNMQVPAGIEPRHIILTAPATGSGTLHFDLTGFDLQFPTGEWRKPGDQEKSDAIARELYTRVRARFSPAAGNPPTPEELARVEKIQTEFIRGAAKPPQDPPKAAAAICNQLDEIIGKSWLSRNRIDTYANADAKAGLTLPGELTLLDADAKLAKAVELFDALETGSVPRQHVGAAIVRFIGFCEYQLGCDYIVKAKELAKIRDLLMAEGSFERYVLRSVTQSSDFLTRLSDPGMVRMQGNIEDLGWGGGSFPGYLHALYLLPDPREIALAMSALKIGINNAIFPASSMGGYLDDGTICHHGVPNWAYGSYCMPGFYEQLGHTYTRYQFLDADRLAYMKRVLMRAEAYSAGLDVPFALRARWLGGTPALAPRAFKAFALHGTIDGSVDKDAAGAYLNMVPKDAGTGEFAARGIKPRPVPAQTFAMPWSCLLVHRDDGFLATVKGFNTRVAAFEMQGSNRLARYLSHGLLQISNNPAGGDNLSFAASGFSFAGLDWNHLPGTTSKPLPYDQLHRNLGRARGTEAFAGGMANSARHAVFAMNLRDIVDKSFVARKSWFFAGNRIVCLGSDIRSDDGGFPIHTTIFQKHLAVPGEPVHLNGSALTTLPYEQTLPVGDQPAWMIDPQGIGYVVPAGQHITLRRSHQISHAASSGDQTIGPSNEADQAVAWLDHGTAPKGAGYEYAILINRPAAEVEKFSQSLGGNGPKPYTVIQKNTDAHILKDEATGTTAYAIFGPIRALASQSLIESASNSLLAMEKCSGHGVLLTLCDPVLHTKPNVYPDEYTPVETTLVLRGSWQAGKLPPNIRVTPAGNTTVVTITSADGKEAEIELTPRP